jgi:hypothetical protein
VRGFSLVTPDEPPALSTSGAFLFLKQYFDFEDDRYCHLLQSLFSLGPLSLLFTKSSGLLIS